LIRSENPTVCTIEVIVLGPRCSSFFHYVCPIERRVLVSQISITVDLIKLIQLLVIIFARSNNNHIHLILYSFVEIIEMNIRWSTWISSKRWILSSDCLEVLVVVTKHKFTSRTSSCKTIESNIDADISDILEELLINCIVSDFGQHTVGAIPSFKVKDLIHLF